MAEDEDLPNLGALSLQPRRARFDDLNEDEREMVLDSVKSQKGGCQEARRQCLTPRNQEHAEWCRSNATWLRDCDVLRIRIYPADVQNDYNQMYPRDPERARQMAQRAIDLIEAMGGEIVIPLTAELAMRRNLLPYSTLMLLRLRGERNHDGRPTGPNVQWGTGWWLRSILVPGYKFFVRSFAQTFDNRSWMVYAEKL